MNKILDFKLIARVISLNLFILSASLLICIGVALIYSENIYPFIISEFITLSLGLIFFLLSKNVDRDKDINKKNAYFTVTTSWILLGLIGTLPYLFSGAIPSFVDAFFESVSGFTTTGSSILTEIESLPKSILFWRSLTHWIGGIGIIMLVIIILPSLKIGGYHLFTSESSFQDKIKPRIRQVGTRLLMIYIVLTIVETVLLILGKMSLFESVCHSFGTVATGGFSPKNTSIADYSPYIQYVIMIFMLLSGTNFIIHYYFIKRDFAKIKENEEFKFYLLLIFIIGSIITAALFFQMNKPLEMSFRESFFQVISIITCTGYATADYLIWPEFAWVLIFFSMFLGGSTGSTAGGIKMVRHLIVFKSIKSLFRQLIHPHAIIPVRVNNKILTNELNNSALSFIVLYFITFLIGTFIMIALGLDGKTASSSVATCMAGIGPGIGTVGPASNFAHIPEIGKILLSFFMIIGRLEIYTVIILFTRSFWKS
ncbi:MAG TPA: TrkH family potassium uptake protein [Bacteroidales bacterium]|nr:TrkH family potassium uptake protein [Bacteroidales bacterium]